MMTGTVSRRAILAGAAGVAASGRAKAQSKPPTLRFGVLTDMSGQYSDVTGPTGGVCARQAIVDFGNADLVAEVIVADHQQKPDIGVSIVREWFDRGDVDVVLDVGNTAVALAIAPVVAEKNKVHLNTGAASSVLTGTGCNANQIHWPYDTWCTANSTVRSILAAGGDRWFFITADYTFGKNTQADATRFVEADGGKVLGSTLHPFPGTTDFSSYLVQALSSGANVAAFCNGGGDTRNCIKQAAEFGLAQRGVRPAAMIAFLQDVAAVGLESAQGLALTETFYWDLNDRTRAFTARVKPKLIHGNYPNMLHAAAYSATLHYLRTAIRLGVAQAKADGRATVAAMKAMPTDDDCFGLGSIRVDGRKLHPAYLFEAKRPAESTGPWDLFRLVGTTSADKAFRPLDQGGCSLA
ncbi:MAG: ABC transporter substrate-binding protein [Janthinobacterium lividum]